MATFEHKGITYNLPSKIHTNNNLLNAFKYYLDHGKVADLKTMKSSSYERDYGRYASHWGDRIGAANTGGLLGIEVDHSDYINSGKKEGEDIRGFWRDLSNIIEYSKTDEFKGYLKEDNPNIAFDEETGDPVIDEETGQAQLTEEAKANSSVSDYNPYTQWLEQQRMTTEGQELGLLNEQTRAGQQNAEISAQQSMIQQAQLRDQIVEQIKLDRMSKMRQGITPMQIANESLQFTVGNIQANNQQMTGVNQARLAATQQQGLNPYQAYLNSVNGAGYQAQGNVASGMAATDASDMYQQALKFAKSQGRNYIKPEDYDIVQGLVRPK